MAMDRGDYLALLFAIVFIIIFIGSISSSLDVLFELYNPRKKRVHPQRSHQANRKPKAASNPTDDTMDDRKENYPSTKANGQPAFDYDANADKAKYYNASHQKSDSFDTSTVTMAYFLEIQSRLNHLKSLLSTKSGDAFDSIQTDDYLMGDSTDAAQQDMVTQIHSNNMKLIEQMIQNAVYYKSREFVAEDNRGFYQKLGDTASGIGHQLFATKSKKKSNDDSNWSRPMNKKKKRGDKVYSKLDFVVELVGERAMKTMFSVLYDLTMKINAGVLYRVGIASLLYSCGALFYCIENDAYVSMIAYQTGIVLVLMVILIGYLFNISALQRNNNSDNEFTAAVSLSIFVAYIALRWVSYYFNVTAAFILLAAIFLSHQYKHGPIYANQRNLDEIWMCLLVNCGLPLFAYYMQCPEMTKMPDIIEAITITASTETVVEAVAVTEQNVIQQTQSTEEDTLITIWLEWLVNTSWRMLANVLTFLWNDFWNMLDLTYSLHEEEVQANACSAQSTNTVTVATNTVPEDAVVVEDAINDAEAVDDTLYWFNKLFYMFPYPLFNIVLISWFVTHSTILIRNITLYKTMTSKVLFCLEILLSYVLSFVFWSNGMFNSMLFYSMILTIPWTLGLLKYVWEHRDIVNDPHVTQHAFMYNLWFFVCVYLAFVWQWISTTGIIYALFSPNLLIVVTPCFFIIQSGPSLVKEFIWATDF
eukprot:58537_1